MRAVYKYPLKVAAQQTIEFPRSGVPISVQLQGDQPTLWAIVDTAELPEDRPVRMLATGEQQNVISPERYIGTVQSHGFVWHYFFA